MPRFAISDDEVAFVPSSGNDRFKFGSMKSMYLQKRALDHNDTVSRVKPLISLSAEMERQAADDWQAKKEKHMDRHRKSVDNVSTRRSMEKAEIENIASAWLHEFNHPSCTAKIGGEVEASTSTAECSRPRQRLISHNKRDLRGNITESPAPAPKTDSPAAAAIPRTVIPSPVTVATPPPAASILKKDTTSPYNFNIGHLSLSDQSFAGIAVSSTTDIGIGSISTSPAVIGKPSFANVFTSTPFPKQIPPISTIPELSEESVLDVTKDSIHSPEGSPLPSDLPKFNLDDSTCSVATTATNALDGDGSMLDFYVDITDFKETNDLKCTRFEQLANKTIRDNMKRTLRDILSVGCKSKATENQKQDTSEKIVEILSKKKVVGYKSAEFQIEDDDGLAFCLQHTATVFLDTLEKDHSLCDVIAFLIKYIAALVPNFDKIIIANCLSLSVLLTLDAKICEKFAQNLTECGVEERKHLVDKEKIIIKLFVLLHAIPSSCKTMTLPAIWRLAAFAINSKARILGTVLVLDGVFQTAAEEMGRYYKNQFRKLASLVLSELVPVLEKSLQDSQLRQTVSEASHISVLRNTLEILV